jgi:stage V sporulation protein B
MSRKYSKERRQKPSSSDSLAHSTKNKTIVKASLVNESSTSRSAHIVSGIRTLTIQNIVNSVLGFVFLTLLLRLLSPSEYGLFTSVSLVTGIGSSIAFFGLQYAATRFVAFTAHDENESRMVSRSIVVLSVIFASCATVVFVLLSPTISLYFTDGTEAAWVFAAAGAWLFSGTISGIFQGLVQGMKKYESLAKILMISNLGMVLVTVIGLEQFNSIIVPIFAWVFYGAVISVWSLSITSKPLPVSNSSETSNQTLNQILKYSLPLGIAGILTVITGAGDPIIVGGFLSQAQLGEYFVAIAISGGLGVILFTPLNTAFFPETASVARDPKRLSEGLRLAFRYTLFALIPVSFALAGLSTQVIKLFSGSSPSYFAADFPLQLMSVFFLFVAMQGILTSLLLSTGKTIQVMLIAAVTVVLDLGLSVLLVPNFGLLGATTSRILVDIAGFLVALYLTRNYLRGVADLKFQAKLFITSIILFAVLSSLSTFISDRVLTLVPYSIIAGIILLLCARGMKLVTEEDKKHLERVIPPRISKLVLALI